jgi:hypothetical protein
MIYLGRFIDPASARSFVVMLNAGSMTWRSIPGRQMLTRPQRLRLLGGDGESADFLILPDGTARDA